MFKINSPFAHGTQIFNPTQTSAAAGAQLAGIYQGTNPQKLIKGGKGSSSNPLAMAASIGNAYGAAPGIQAGQKLSDDYTNAQHALRINNAGEQFANAGLQQLYGNVAYNNYLQNQQMQNPLYQTLFSWLGF